MSYHFGVYIEIKTKKVEKRRLVRKCANGHTKTSGAFCPECGEVMKEIELGVWDFPLFLVDSILDVGWQDVLSEITPPSLRGTNKILAVANMRPGGYLKTASSSNEVIDFPTQAEIEAMQEEFVINHSDVMVVLRNSPYVVSISVKAGIILDIEW
jgi:hypothetical protein